MKKGRARGREGGKREEAAFNTSLSWVSGRRAWISGLNLRSVSGSLLS